MRLEHFSHATWVRIWRVEFHTALWGAADQGDAEDIADGGDCAD